MFESCRAHRRLPVRRLRTISAEARFVAGLPDLLTVKRHRDLEGIYVSGLVVRRIGYAALLTISVLAILNVFGQRPWTSTVDADAATLQLYAPTHLRGGLLFMARFRITAKQDLKRPTLVLAPGWAESMSINTIEPSPTNETSDNGRLSFELGPLSAGRTFVLYMEFQVNPTNVGRRSQDVELLDGDTRISTIHRTVTVYP
jgi:hypothetical protein